MFETYEKTQKIWVYDTHKQSFVYCFPTFLDALKFLAVHGDEFLENINMGNDKTFHDYENLKLDNGVYYYDNIIYIPRRFIFIDENNRYIDFRNYRNEIDELINSKNLKYNCLPQKKKQYKESYKYRFDPVPHTGHIKGYRWLRHIHTTNEKRQNCALENKEFVRAARRANNLPSLYDDIPRSYSKSWKDCTKKRKQWM